MSMKVLVLGILALLIVAIIAYFGVGAYIAFRLTVPGESPVTYDPEKIAQRYTNVVFRSKDNLPLAGWYFPGSNGKAVMFVHGAGNQNRANEVYAAPEIAKYFHSLGYTILMFDLRGTGESAMARISFGQYESRDVAGAFAYLIQQDFDPESIGIISDSLGAISTIMASDDVKKAGAIVLDSPASILRPIVSNIMTREHNIPEFLHPAIYLSAKIFYNIDVDVVRPIDKISTLTNTPLLFLHGEADTLIPAENSAQLNSKVKNGEVVIFKGAEHVETFKSNPELYKNSINDLFQNLKTPNV